MERAIAGRQCGRPQPHALQWSIAFPRLTAVCHAVIICSLLVFMILTFEACDGGGNGDGNGGSVATCSAIVPQTCANVDGLWDVAEEVTATCTADGESETETVSGSGRIRLNQNGCALSYTVPRLDVRRTGVIDGTSVCLSGPFVQAIIEGVNFSENTLTIEGELIDDNTIVADGTGRATGSVDDLDFVCTARSTANFTRVGTVQIGSTSLAGSTDSEAPLTFFDDAVRLLSIVIQ